MKKAFIIAAVIVLLLLVIFILTLRGIDQNERARLLDIPLGEQEYTFLLSAENAVLSEIANAVIADMKKDGSLSALTARFTAGDPDAVVYPAKGADASRSQLIFATEANLSAFSYAKDGGYTGIDIALAAAIAERADCELVIRVMEHYDAVRALQAGEVDLYAPDMRPADPASLGLSETAVYAETSLYLLISKGETRFDGCKTADDVAKVLASFSDADICGVENRSAAFRYLTGDSAHGYAGFPNVKALSYKTEQLALDDLMAGESICILVFSTNAKRLADSVNVAPEK